MGRRVVIVGGVAAGMSAATRLRRLDEEASITVLEAGDHVSFANCGLPYHVGDVIPDRGALLRDAGQIAERFRLDVRRGHEVVALDRDARTVRVRSADGETDEPYDVLVLASGAAASPLPTDGSVPTHTLRTVEDMDAIRAAVDGGVRRAVVVGGGYIGLEATENLVRRGVEVSLVIRGDQVLRTLDAEMAAPVHEHLVAHGVALRFGAAAERVDAGHVVLDDGERLLADLVVDGTGVRPASSLAERSGLDIGPTGGIAVDARHRTSDPAILAAGDDAEKQDAIGGEPALVALAGLANRHGRAVADVIAEAPAATDAPPALGTAIVQVFGLAVATLGWTEARLREAGRAIRVVHTHPIDHAAYYPGAEQMTVKLMIDAEDDRLLGAQIVGRAGVDKRIDVLATAIAGGITASRLSQLELAYAPQFGSAKDPVNLAGYVAENLALGQAAAVQWHELPGLLADGWTLVDVRSPGEFARGAIPGAVNLPLDELRARHGELPADRVVVHCQVGQRGFTAARLLGQLGHDVANLDGGYRTWRDGEATRRQETDAEAAEQQG
ncbi:FAD-dependent oxidoreductase [Amnibacterium endophyticum]|uniref:FAD-dependent oxidoreductase n=1 Tax=Amnibacterium endophyticum TaxID=2109337 RepID=A0ABW4LDB6_9MICO